uniref:Uncharacterized protein n=1 Tax=Rhizophora mucronata TaxID=61149 RepID=A0A2P2PE50_RHIMU
MCWLEKMATSCFQISIYLSNATSFQSS